MWPSSNEDWFCGHGRRGPLDLSFNRDNTRVAGPGDTVVSEQQQKQQQQQHAVCRWQTATHNASVSHQRLGAQNLVHISPPPKKRMNWKFAISPPFFTLPFLCPFSVCLRHGGKHQSDIELPPTTPKTTGKPSLADGMCQGSGVLPEQRQELWLVSMAKPLLSSSHGDDRCCCRHRHRHRRRCGHHRGRHHLHFPLCCRFACGGREL
mmetsp:Transcript_11970/g.32944  ORF Transcript_11970/g.32944 Transcript_11970/m.32944 type:complete len:207 (+) Transcript_11970:83-703(+)